MRTFIESFEMSDTFEVSVIFVENLRRDFGIEISKLLYLRRHEKDFFLRHDTKYLDEYNKLETLILRDLKKHSFANQYAMYHLQEYSRIFNDLVKVQMQIGLSSNQGLRHELNNLTFFQ